MENETVNQEQATEAKTFTQQEMDAIITDRLKRERAKYEGFEDYKAKALKFDEIEAANKSELDKAQERVNALETELNGLKRAEELRAIRTKVASETGIPASSISLITGETEEECLEQAKTILSLSAPQGYPIVKDGGELTGNVITGTNKQRFADWFNESVNIH